jgi:transcriptional regulator with XRE-family HTH domain
MRRVPPDVKDAESAALRALFEAWKTRTGQSQAQFAGEQGIGTPAMVWQYLSGHRPLNLEAALKFAAGLGKPIESFSPRLAEQARAASSLSAPGLKSRVTELVAREAPAKRAQWPFKLVDRARYERLPPDEREIIEALVLKRVVEWESRIGLQREAG